MWSFARPVLTGLGGVFATKLAHDAYYADWNSISDTVKRDLYHLLLKLPVVGRGISANIEKELDPMLAKIEHEIKISRAQDSTYHSLDHPRPKPEQLLAKLNTLNAVVSGDSHYKISGALYCPLTTDIDKLTDTIYRHAKYSNPLHPGEWPQLMEMTAEIVSSTMKLFKGPTDGSGFGALTPGGTHSNIEAVKACKYRFDEQQNIFQRMFGYVYQAKPEMIIADTAHASFDKAAKMYGIKLVKVKSLANGEADVEAMAKKINKNTIMIVGSAPSYPTGTVDNIPELGRLAQKHNIALHVDACLGGGVVPFLQGTTEAARYPFGFEVPGVSSLSLDPHKQFMADKGSSMVLYRSFEELGKYQTSSHMKWNGGIYATPGTGGSASGFNIVNTWAMMHYFAQEGYKENALKIRKVLNAIRTKLDAIEGISIMGRPDAQVIAFQSSDPGLNIHVVVDQMKERGWRLNTLPTGFHLCITGVHIEHKTFVDEFIADLTQSALYAKQNPGVKPKSDGAIYGAQASLPNVFNPVMVQMSRDYHRLQLSLNRELPPADSAESRQQAKKRR